MAQFDYRWKLEISGDKISVEADSQEVANLLANNLLVRAVSVSVAYRTNAPVVHLDPISQLHKPTNNDVIDLNRAQRRRLERGNGNPPAGAT